MGVLVLLVVLAIVVSVGASGPLAGDPPRGSQVVPATPAITDLVPSAAPSARPVVDIPGSIDATGTKDVTASLQAVLDAAPNGATIRFAPRARYLIRSALVLDHRVNVLLDGRGATIILAPGDGKARRNLWLIGCREVRITDLALLGANPHPGVLDDARQYEHGIWIDGGGGIEVASVTVTDPWGDCVYLGDGDGRQGWVDGVWIHDSSCSGTGRNGISIVAGRNVRIERNTLATIGLHAIDVEPNPPSGGFVQGADRIEVVGNRVSGPVSEYFFAANGWGPVDNLTIEQNVLTGTPMRLTVQPLPASRQVRRSVLVSGNRSDTPFNIKDDPAMKFAAVIGLTVTDNDVPLGPQASALAAVTASCQVQVYGNQIPRGARELIGGESPCPEAAPVPTAPPG